MNSKKTDEENGTEFEKLGETSSLEKQKVADISSGDLQNQIENTISVQNPQSNAIQPGLDIILTGINNLQQSFDAKIRYDASKERIIDSLHKELQDYRDGLHAKILRPIFLDLIAMHDDLRNLLRFNNNLNQESGEAALRLLQNLISFQQSIEDVLEKHGVTGYEESGDVYSAQRQRALRTENTADAGMDRIVSERIRKGFEYDGKVLRPEIVTIYKFNGTTQKSTQEAQ